MFRGALSVLWGLRARAVAVGVIGLVGVVGAAHAGEAHVAVAANFADPMKAVAAALQRDTGHTLRVTVGATGKLYAQIKQGAPFDVLLAANAEVPAQLVADGLAVPASRFTYARGQLVLWSAQPGRVDPQGAVLRSPTLAKVAHAAPKVAPYGAAALQAVAALGLTDALAGKWVVGESIGQTYTFVHTGNADMGFVALSQVMAEGRLKAGSAWVVPPSLYAPISQDAVLLKRGEHNAAAVALLDALKTPAYQALIRGFGYTF